jgi:hypothetical protein
VVDIHFGEYNPPSDDSPPAHVPLGSCLASKRAPQPSRAIFRRSYSTVRWAAPTRSRCTCHRIAGSPSSSHRITLLSLVTSTAPQQISFCLANLTLQREIGCGRLYASEEPGIKKMQRSRSPVSNWVSTAAAVEQGSPFPVIVRSPRCCRRVAWMAR